jgi:hypothetical protein
MTKISTFGFKVPAWVRCAFWATFLALALHDGDVWTAAVNAFLLGSDLERWLG